MATIKNYRNGEWVASKSKRTLDVVNPATTKVLARVPVSTREEVNEAIQSAKEAYEDWRETPPLTRARYMFTLKSLMEEHFEEVSCILVQEHGKVIDEGRGEVRRAIECVEHAAGIPTLMMGYNLETIASGMDEECILQPLGVFCCLPPSNMTYADVLAAAKMLEERMEKFYSEAGQKISFIPVVSRVYKRNARDKARALRRASVLS
jgi:malonate-semialdehyde dehydrogenase (acetylating)/methylmalonate-semialdehyde dehydrogenase